MVKSIATKLLIRAIEGINHAVSYFEHDIKRGNARKTVAISIVLLFVVGIAFIGSGVTGQITRARESASTLSEKLGSIESNFQKLTVDYNLLNEETKLCAGARDRYLTDLDGCKATLSQKTSLYETTKAEHSTCVTNLDAKTTQYNTCASSISGYDALKTAHTALNNTYNSLNTKYNSVVVNVVKDYCNCGVRLAGSTINYQITDANRVVCFVDDSQRTGFVTC